jgi:hypothetical protein
MSSEKLSQLHRSILTIALAMLAVCNLPLMHAQRGPAFESGRNLPNQTIQATGNNQPNQPKQLKGLPDDWTFHHVIYSNPGTESEAIAHGKLAEWQRVVNDPRYLASQLQRHAPVQGPMASFAAAFNAAARARGVDGVQEPSESIGRDNFRFFRDRKRGQMTENIHSDWQMNLGFNAHVELDQYPAKYSFDATAPGQCAGTATPDYVTYMSGLAGSGTQASIIAYDNLYSGCSGSGAVPNVYWSYVTGPNIPTTSPVISLDGTKVAFMETPETGAATLRIIKWKGGQGTDYKSPAAPDNSFINTTAGAGTNTAWTSCPAGQSCLISVTFQTQLNADIYSDPYYDYDSDTLWVGDAAGFLHEFTGVFNGTPGEVTTGNWPVDLSGCGVFHGSPVYDQVHQLIYIGNFCGGLSAIDLAGDQTNSSAVGFGGPDISSTPIIDPVAGQVYLFVAQDLDGNAGVFQFPSDFSPGATGTEATIGAGTVGSTYVFTGAFDNAYYSSPDSSSPSGNLWVCGNPGGDPTLYAVPIAGNLLGTSVTSHNLSTGTGAVCSPVTEFCVDGGSTCASGGGTDYLVVSPQTEPGAGQVTGCSAGQGCVISYTLNGTTATLSGAGPFSGGASGMIIDTQNTTTGGTLQIYFELLNNGASCAGNGEGQGNGTGACAIQAPLAVP